MRASGIVAWAWDKNRAPSSLYDDGVKTDLRPSKLSGGHLYVSDEVGDSVYEAQVMSRCYYVDVGTEDRRLEFESSGTQHHVKDTETKKEYDVEVNGNKVIIKAQDEVKTLEVY
jgi:hypothetical protein